MDFLVFKILRLFQADPARLFIEKI